MATAIHASLEWFEIIAKDEGNYDLAKLEAAINGKKEDFIQDHLTNVIAETVGADFKEFLKRSSVFRIPVPADAFNQLGDSALLETGVNLTLHEQETLGRVDHFWVTPVIRQRQWDELDAVEKKRIHKIAYKWFADILDELLNKKKLPEYNHLQEAVHHALKCDNIRVACKYAIALGNYMEKLLLYRDSLLLQQKVADRITPDIEKEAIKEKDEYVAMLLNNLGESVSSFGDPAKAIEYYEKALAIDLAAYGDKHPEVATDYNNIGSAWRDLDDPAKAKEYYEKALAIDLAAYGNKHPEVATDYNNIGSAWRDLDDPAKAKEYYEKALAIFLDAYGDNHPNVARDYNNIGAAWSDLGDPAKAKEYYEKALAIDLA
ncbi:MAG: tetratricopeptide repeat protein, partial [Nitrospirae bacterium]|nr:tetratricopeptide repeat protein [Nitrospirota bacterium]